MNRALVKIAAFAFCFALALPSRAAPLDLPCAHPASYGLAPEELSAANREFYCWEIKYMKERKGALSMGLDAYRAELRAWMPYIRDVDELRRRGITPEKAEFLERYFVDRDYIELVDSGKSDESIISGALAKAKNYMRSNRMEYKVGRVFFTPYLLSLDAANPANLIAGTAYFSLFVMPMICVGLMTPLNTFAFGDYYPDALRPVGVVGKSFVNAFGEVVGDIRAEDRFGAFVFDGAWHKIYVHGTDRAVGSWDSARCNITDVKHEISRSMACLSCTIFEIAFNTVSKVGFVMYDKLSRYALGLMAVLFLLWTLWMFFDNVVRKGEPFEFIKAFFNRSMLLFLAACALSVSIRDKDNFLNYFLAPATDFMTGYNKTLTSAIDNSVRDRDGGGKEWKCKYLARYSTDSDVLFSREVKQNIVCTIERIADFNNMNSLVGRYSAKQGWRQVIGFGFSGNVLEGLLKLLAGLCIMGMFLYMNLTVPFYFIESIFLIGIVVFLMPMFLAACPFSKDADSSLVKKGFYTFLSAVFQIISLTLMCSVISILMMHVSGLDYYRLNRAAEIGDQQEAVAELMYMLSFDFNDLLQIIYTGIVCFYLLGEAVKIANSFSGIGGGSSLGGGNLPKKWLGWTKNTIAYVTSVGRDKVGMLKDSRALAAKTIEERGKRKARDKLLKELASGPKDGEGA